MKRLLPLIALTLALCMLLGCSLSWNSEPPWEDLIKESTPEETSGQTLTYVRPDMDEHDRVLEEACELAATETSASRVMDGVYAYYDQYDLVYAALEHLPEGSALEVIEGASHVAYIEKPCHKDFQERLIRFLDGTGADAVDELLPAA
jgi:hypothetical protein